MATRTTSATRQLTGRYGAIKRHHPEVDTTELRRDMAAAALADYVAHAVAAAPPLTPAQRDRIAALLRGGA